MQAHTCPDRRPAGRRLRRSFYCAFQGLLEALRHQPNLRIHLGCVAAVTALGLWLGLSWSQWAILVLTFVVVLGAELVNSSLEYVTDLACPEYHPLAGHAKDMSAGAVLIAALGAVIVGLLVLGPPLVAAIGGS